ncbi:MAG TPA: ABC transporter permease, partial [Bacilli bacterium]|nr:ABC transporter permease [Bacilli bacterium]
MFFHNFKYSFKVLLKNKALIFWTIMWPILLGTMFNVAFSNIYDSEKLTTIDIGVVDNEAYQEDNALTTTLKELSDKNSDSYLFKIKYDDEETLTTLLTDKKISAYIVRDKDTKVVIKENGINQTITKYVIDQIYEYENLATNMIKYNIETEMKNGKSVNAQEIYNNVIKDLNSNKTYLVDKSKSNTDYTVIEFYTLIAMTALFGAMLTSNVVSNYLANINKKGARVTLAP